MSEASVQTGAPIDDAIVSAKTYAEPGAYDLLFAQLRREAPLRWTEPTGYRPFWTVTRYKDIQEIESKPDIFLNAPRLLLRTMRDEEKTKRLTGGSTVLLRNLVNMDAPDHMVYRKLTQAWFMPVHIKALEDDLHALARECVQRMVDMGGACDFVRDVAVWYPLRVIMRILGVPKEDEPKMLKLTQEIFGPDDPDIKQSSENRNIAETVAEFARYFGALTAERRRSPTSDVASIIANAEIGGKPIADHEALSYYIIIATAGHDTTSSTTAGGLLALLENPEQLARLRADPALLPGAVDEMIRWVTPVKHFFRTAAQNYTLRGETIGAGDNLMMCYPSANRDEDVFESPFSFDIARSPNRHIAFGYGPHVCLGQYLAKMEVRIFFEEMLSRISSLKLAGDPAWVQSNFVSGLKRLPIRYET
ncbi:MAG TPA: cytochrome P450 [Rhizomicrobium sp.]|nr:cytochrome P450 [Rhizomicrobium sp.]